MKTLIAYYSRGGTTKRTAEQLAELTGGDLFEIRGKKNYGNYFKALSVSRKEFSSGELPEIEPGPENFDEYDRILLGFPIWFSKCPQLILTFLTSHDLKGKDIYPFCTSGASGPEGAQEQLKENCEGANLHPGIRLNKVEEDKVKTWLGGTLK